MNWAAIMRRANADRLEPAGPGEIAIHEDQGYLFGDKPEPEPEIVQPGLFEPVGLETQPGREV